jgi:alanine dehydrogenase
MKKGAVLVDVSIDQGGCFETSRPTTHADPVFTMDGVIHYCVANMPGAVPRTSTYALNHATLPFVLEMAQRGVMEALRTNAGLRDGLNIFRGKVTRREVAEALGYAHCDAREALAT